MSKPVILCIDDENIILQSLKDQLKLYVGTLYAIETAESGEEALEIVDEIQENNYELPLAISDQIMPGIKGEQVLAEIHKKMPNTFTVLLTGQADAAAVGYAVNHANLYRYIAKPWEKTDLQLTVNQALKSYRQNKTIWKQNAILQKLIAQLQQSNLTLEQRVEERTHEINQQKEEIESQRDRIEEQCVEYQKLNATKDRLFSVLAHDLKNPFNTLMNITTVLISEFYKLTDKQKLLNIEDLHHAIKEAYRLLENLLQWSRSQINRLDLKFETIVLRDLVTDAIAISNIFAQKKQIAIENQIPADVYVTADANTIHIVLRNLISNAIKFTKKHGKIIVKSEKKHKLYKISVVDNGIGIKPKDQEKLFRLESSFTTRGTQNERGTGLGLILCKEFVEKNKGELSLKSKPNEGSAFSFTLPETETTRAKPYISIQKETRWHQQQPQDTNNTKHAPHAFNDKQTSTPEKTDALKQNFLTRWQNVKENNRINDLQDFASDLSAFATKNQWNALEQYANHLLDDINNFRVDCISDKMKQFAGWMKISDKKL